MLFYFFFLCSDIYYIIITIRRGLWLLFEDSCLRVAGGLSVLVLARVLGDIQGRPAGLGLVLWIRGTGQVEFGTLPAGPSAACCFGLWLPRELSCWEIKYDFWGNPDSDKGLNVLKWLGLRRCLILGEIYQT